MHKLKNFENSGRKRIAIKLLPATKLVTLFDVSRGYVSTTTCNIAAAQRQGFW